MEDPRSGQAIKRNYLHRATLDGERIGATDIPLPDRTRIFHVDGSVLALGEYVADHLELVWYELATDAPATTLR